MKINIGDYLIETDSLQFIVSVKKVVGESNFTKQENIGKVRWQPIAYPTTFDSALRFIPQEVLRTNDDIVVIKQKLDEIGADIEALKIFKK